MTATAPTALPQRLSPVHEKLEHLRARWTTIDAMPAATDFGDADGEARRARDLGLCDASALPRLTLKGAPAAALLAEQGAAVPERFGQVGAFGRGGLIARTGGAEFFIEDAPPGGGSAPAPGSAPGSAPTSAPGDSPGSAMDRLREALRTPRPGLYPIHRQDASFLLSGERAALVLAQTCGYNFRLPVGDLIFTRVAGVSCSVVSRRINDIPLFQLWLDCSMGVYLWETLLEIAGELGGAAVGLAAFHPQLISRA